MTPKSKLRTIGETANFFGRSVMWIRDHETRGDFKYSDGTRIEPIRNRETKTGSLGSRKYTLEMIEDMAISLERAYVINKYERERVLNIVDAHRKVEK